MRAADFKMAVAALTLGAALVTPASAQSARVLVNNREVEFVDQSPIERDGRIYIPLRGVLEEIGAETIQWRPARGEVFVQSGEREILLNIGSERARVDNRDVFLDAPPILLGGRTLVPLRFVAENLGATVRWVGDTRTVYISVPQDRVAGERETYPPDRANDRPVRPRRGPRDLAPRIRPVRPVAGEAVYSRRPEITAVIRDPNGADIDFDSIRMRINGQDVTADLEMGRNSVTYRPTFDLERGDVAVQVTARDRQGNVSRRDWTFEVR